MTITGQPLPPEPVPVDGFFLLGVEAVGKGPLRYQWQRNGVNIPGETQATFFRVRFTLADAGSYRVLVSDEESTVASDSIGVLPQVAQLLFNDVFGAAAAPAAIQGRAGSGAGNNLVATAQPGEPAHAGRAASASMWIAWRPDVTGVATLDTAGSDFDTVLAVYASPPGRPPALVELIPVAANDDGPLTTSSRVVFNVRPAVDYHIAVDGVQSGGRSGRGRISLAWKAEPTSETVPVVSQQPTSLTTQPGEPGEFKIAFAADPSAVRTEVQWFRGDVAIPGATGLSLKFAKITEAEVSPYHAVITQFYADGSTRAIRTEVVDIQLSEQSDGKTTGVRAHDKFAQLLLDLPLLDTDPAPPAPARGRPRPLGLGRGVSGTQVFSSVAATGEAGEPVHCGAAGGASEWYPILADADGVMVIDTKGSGFDTVLAVYLDAGGGLEELQPVACNDDVSATEKTSAVSFCARKGTIYVVVVDGVAGASGKPASGKVKLNYALLEGDAAGLCAAPKVVCPLVADRMVVPVGGSATLSFQATATPPVSHQWKRDGTPIVGATNATFALRDAQPADAGVYEVVVSNTFGSDSRAVSTVEVHTGPAPRMGYQRQCDGGLLLLVAAPDRSSVVLEMTTDLQHWLPIGTNTATKKALEFMLTPEVLGTGQSFRALIR